MEYRTVQPDSEDLRRIKTKAVAQLLRTLRMNAGLRQEDLGQRLNRTQSYVSKYENSESRLDVVELLEICDALGTSFGSFASLLESELAK